MVALEFLDPRPAKQGAVDALEARIGSPLPPSFQTLLVEVSNGGEVEPTAAQSAPQVGIVALLGAGRGDGLDLEARLAQYRGGRLPDGLVPVADAEGGNLVCVSIRPRDFGTVWFWDHEKELSGNAAAFLADDFDAFLADLAPIAESEIPSAVTEAWVDPALLAELEGGQG